MKNVFLKAILGSCFLQALLFLCSHTAIAQVKIGDNTATLASPNPSAMLEIESNNKGLLLPRVALSLLSSSSPLATHVEGMVVYNTATLADVVPGYYYNDGTRWVQLEQKKQFVSITLPDEAPLVLPPAATQGTLTSFTCTVTGNYVFNAHAQVYYQAPAMPYAEIYSTATPVFTLATAQLLAKQGTTYTAFATPATINWTMATPIYLTAGTTYYIWIYSQTGGNTATWGASLKNTYLYKID